MGDTPKSNETGNGVTLPERAFWNRTQVFLTSLAGVLVAIGTIIAAVKTMWPVKPPPPLISMVTIPPLRGNDLKSAEDWLTAAEMKFVVSDAKITSTPQDAVPPGRVATQEPAAGLLLPGQTIFLTPEATWVQVPDLQDQLLSDAKKAIAQFQLTIGSMQQSDGKPVTENIGSWKVITQSPPANAVAKPLAPVTLTCQLVAATYNSPRMKMLRGPQFMHVMPLPPAVSIRK